MAFRWMSSRAGSRRSTSSADYCYHVASVVGLCCLHIWGYRSEGGKAERLAESCGIALQLTNIIRDVREDARNGRIYLPVEDLRRFRVDPGELGRGGIPNERVRALLAFEAERAYEYYLQSSPLAPLVNRVGPASPSDDRGNLPFAAR